MNEARIGGEAVPEEMCGVRHFRQAWKLIGMKVGLNMWTCNMCRQCPGSICVLLAASAALFCGVCEIVNEGPNPNGCQADAARYGCGKRGYAPSSVPQEGCLPLGRSAALRWQ